MLFSACRGSTTKNDHDELMRHLLIDASSKYACQNNNRPIRGRADKVCTHEVQTCTRYKLENREYYKNHELVLVNAGATWGDVDVSGLQMNARNDEWGDDGVGPTHLSQMAVSRSVKTMNTKRRETNEIPVAGY